MVKKNSTNKSTKNCFAWFPRISVDVEFQNVKPSIIDLGLVTHYKTFSAPRLSLIYFVQLVVGRLSVLIGSKLLITTGALFSKTSIICCDIKYKHQS